ncbi:MAG TPA: pyridoxal 5'-phosphate synthase glutaminase subunit PdxT [Acidobacteriaceae bacterium]|nr:pyridoxal 5'-phosphate synthase glutaminase subunit PdxT [Acidobacteriaceae bacterium]
MHSSSNAPPLTIGVLALQGDYASHARALEEIGVGAKMVRKAQELVGIDGLIIPGGESTTFLKLLAREELFEPLQSFAASRPTFGTCAGCILLAKQVSGPEQESLGVLDASVERNAYGRQIDSEILTKETSLPGGPLEMVFIRAPRILEVGAEVEVLATRDGFPILVRGRSVLAATFHPELSEDRRVHRYFLQMVQVQRNSGTS